MNVIFGKIETSFKLALQGKETVKNLLWWWGGVAYLVTYFITDRLISSVDSRFVDVLLSVLTVVYFAWHFYVLRKCAPKKPKLSKEEKKKLRIEARKELGKKFLRKLFLQESITKWDPVFMCLVVDVFCVARFSLFITN